MNCPKCNNEMMQVVKYGVGIDTCATCGGIWLDKGELGELMARINQAGTSIDQELSRVQPSRPDYDRPYNEDKHHYRDDHYSDHDHHDYKHKKRSIWDIFD